MLMTSSLRSVQVFALVVSVIAFHEKAGRSQVDCFLLDKVFVFILAESPLSPPFHPHSSVSDCRSVQVGCSRFSRCCYLLSDLLSTLKNGSWARRLTQSPKLGI